MSEGVVGISFNICTEDGWEEVVFQAPRSVVDGAYALPSSASRPDYFNRKLGTSLPEGSHIVWREL